MDLNELAQRMGIHPKRSAQADSVRSESELARLRELDQLNVRAVLERGIRKLSGALDKPIKKISVSPNPKAIEELMQNSELIDLYTERVTKRNAVPLVTVGVGETGNDDLIDLYSQMAARRGR